MSNSICLACNLYVYIMFIHALPAGVINDVFAMPGDNGCDKTVPMYQGEKKRREGPTQR